jgi:hypothetical protein
VTMPPYPYLFDGLDAIAPLMAEAIGLIRMDQCRQVATQANRMPTAASYLRRPGDSPFRAFKLDMLRIEAGRIAEIIRPRTLSRLRPPAHSLSAPIAAASCRCVS